MYIDIDSIYGYSEKFKRVVDFLGKGSRFRMFSNFKHTNSSTGSRFAVDCRRLYSSPITVKGNKVQRINFEDLPNLNICQATVDGMNGVTFTIGFHFTGLLFLRDRNYLCHLELAVLMTAMNWSKLLLIKKDDLTVKQRQEISKLPKFVCDTHGEFRQVISSLNADVLMLFVREFEFRLKHLSEPGPHELKIQEMSGMMRKRFDQDMFRKTALYLSRHHVISFSVAGIKNFFMRNSENSIKIVNGSTLDNIEFGSREFEKLMEAKANKLLKTIRMRFGSEDGQTIPFFYDVGFELVPQLSKFGFFVNGIAAKTRLKTMMQ